MKLKHLSHEIVYSKVVDVLLNKGVVHKGCYECKCRNIDCNAGGVSKNFVIGDEGVKKLRRAKCKTNSVWVGSK